MRDQHSRSYQPRKAVSGLVGEAVKDGAGRPISYASRPASTALRKARAMRTGSAAMAMAVLTSTAAAPISMASAAWLGSAEAGIDDDGDAGLLDDDLDLRAGLDAAIAADGRAERHDGGGADILEALGQDGIGVDVGEDDEAFGGQDFGGLEGLDRVRQQVARIGVDFEFHPFRQPGGGGEPGKADGLVGVHRAAGIGEEEVSWRGR